MYWTRFPRFLSPVCILPGFLHLHQTPYYDAARNASSPRRGTKYKFDTNNKDSKLKLHWQIGRYLQSLVRSSSPCLFWVSEPSWRNKLGRPLTSWSCIGEMDKYCAFHLLLRYNLSTVNCCQSFLRRLCRGLITTTPWLKQNTVQSTLWVIMSLAVLNCRDSCEIRPMRAGTSRFHRDQ